jgi:hypothetical protein
LKAIRRAKTIRHVTNDSRAIVPIDSGPIRSEWKGKLDSLRFEIGRWETIIAEHDDADEPAYQTWLRTTFGPLFSEAQEIAQKTARLSHRLDLLKLLRTRSRKKTDGELYHLAIAIEEGRVPSPEDPAIALEELKRQARRFSDFEKEIPQPAIDELTDDMGEIPTEFRDLRAELSPQQNIDSKARCQAIYRKIALALHPDRAGPMSEETKALWFRAQSGYEILDLVALESILDRCCCASPMETSISALQAAVRDGVDQLNRLQARVERLKKSPSWRFRKLSQRQLESRMRSIGRELEDDLEVSRAILEALESQCSRLENARNRWLEKNHSCDQLDLFLPSRAR